MVPTAAEPIVFHSGPVNGVYPQDYPTTYGHLINSFCFDLEASTLFIYYSQETTKKCQFCFEKLPIIEQNKYEFCTSWHSVCKIQYVNINCNSCWEALITPRFRATDCKGCTEQFLKNRMQLHLGNEVMLKMFFDKILEIVKS